jgi:hypothetical protein
MVLDGLLLCGAESGELVKGAERELEAGVNPSCYFRYLRAHKTSGLLHASCAVWNMKQSDVHIRRMALLISRSFLSRQPAYQLFFALRTICLGSHEARTSSSRVFLATRCMVQCFLGPVCVWLPKTSPSMFRFTSQPVFRMEREEQIYLSTIYDAPHQWCPPRTPGASARGP